MAVTIYGVCALSFMMVMYALEARGRRFIALFALGCALSSAYGFLSGAWPFGAVEAIWTTVAVARYARFDPRPLWHRAAGARGAAKEGAQDRAQDSVQDQGPPSSSG